nr:hypothetical protein CTI12_AA123990 [Tanacetum cinerariifolium]
MSAFMIKETPETVDKNIVANLIQMLDQTSAMAKSFRMAKEWRRSHGDANFGLRLLSERTATRQYNAPTVSEVSALIINDFGDGLPIRDIVVNKNNTGPQRILELHPSYMALQYPLLFLFAIEEQRLNWTRNNQDTLRVDLYHNLCDVVTRGDTSAAGLVKRIVLPRTYVGSPRDNKITTIKGKFTYDNKHVVPHNRGAQSFTDLKMVNKINYATFKAACFAYGLLTRNGHTLSQKQILPVFPNAKRPEVIQGCINQSELWKYCKVFTLTRSMRVNEFSCNGEIDNRKQDFNRWIVAEMYPDFTLRKGDDEYLTERAILTPTNDDADAINENMFKKLGGPPVTHNSADEICKASTDNANQHDLYPVEFLN